MQNPRKTFKPFIPQVNRSNLAPHLEKKTGPINVHFTWAVRPEVTQRGEHGEVLAVNHENWKGAPQMKFQSVDSYLRWHENMSVWQENQEILDDEPALEREVPDWMLDMADERRFGGM
jgi:hypothetical protein